MRIRHNAIRILTKGWNSPTVMTWGNMLSSSAKLLVLTPLILVNYNVNEIAFWYLLLTINSLAVVIDFGFYPTFSRVISYAYNGLDHIKDITHKIEEKNKNGLPSWVFMQRIYGTLNVVYFLMIFIVTTFILVFTLSSVSVIIDRTSEPYLLWTSYIIFILSIVFSFLARRSDTVIIGTNHVALINRWNILNNLANSVSSILIVYFEFDIIWLAINQLVFSILLLLRNYYMERHICDGKFKLFKLFGFDKEIFKWIWGPTWQSGVLILASTGVTQITGIFYSNMSSSAELASYLITLKLVTTISQFSQAPFYSKLPVFSGLRVNYEIGRLAEGTANAMLKSLFVFVFGMAALFYLGDFMLVLIGANSQLESPPFLILMAFVWFFERHHAMHAQIFSTTNKISFYKSTVLCGILNVGLIYFFVPKIGVWAFPLSQGISNLFINNWWNVYLSLQSLQQGFFSYFKRSALVPLGILVVLSSVCLLLYYC